MKKAMLLSGLAVGVMLSVIGCGGSSGDGFSLTSTSFKDGTTIPKKYAYYKSGGENISPQLSWENAPDETDMFLLLVDDPDAKHTKAGRTWLHWLAGIDIEETSLDEGASETGTFLGQGTNSYRKRGYGGPNPPKGGGVHHYRFCLYAVEGINSFMGDVTKIDTQEQAKATLGGHILGTACLTGTYENPVDGGGEVQSIVGTWHKDCYQDDHGTYNIEDTVVKDDGTGTYHYKVFSDDKCQVLDYQGGFDFTYKTGEATTDDHGKVTTKLDLVKDPHGAKHHDYTMYRFKENGNLLTAVYTDEYPGDDDASRENHIDPNWTGYTRVK